MLEILPINQILGSLGALFTEILLPFIMAYSSSC
jgi:hypothetical protein